jgi:hypothetical protein
MTAAEGEKKTPAEGTAPEPKVIPSFSKVAEETRDARAAELAGLAGIKPGESKTAPEGEAPPANDFEKRWSELPEDFRGAIYQSAYSRAYGNINGFIEKEYKDLMPLIPVIRDNANLRTTLAAMATDPELLEVLQDPKGREMLKDLSKKELREFLFGEAKSTYEKYATPNDTIRNAGAAPDERDQKISALEQRFEDERNARETSTYISNRQREYAALQNQYPELKTKDGQAMLAHVLQTTEDRFEADALRAGIKTRNNDGTLREAFAAEALRKGIKPLDYRSQYEYLAEAMGKPRPSAAPSTTQAVTPAPAAAPRTAAEGKQRATELLKAKGGFNALAKSKGR